MGSEGPQGAKGNTGPAGPRGPVGIVPCWVSYREFWFGGNSADILDTQKAMLVGMAKYVKNNPSLILGLDGYIDNDHKDLSNSRINNVRDGLINAGVPAERIRVGDFGDSKLRRDGRVEVLIMTGQ
jgi:outer membrane protein OmpA-like peptidoglycan-associated protein